jgi:hypothetical protein
MPLAEILVLLGFFMIYIVEEVVHHGVDWYHKKHVAKVAAANDDDKNKGEDGDEKAGLHIEVFEHLCPGWTTRPRCLALGISSINKFPQ